MSSFMDHIHRSPQAAFAARERISHEIMPRIYRAVLDASHRGDRVTVVVGPALWGDILRASDISPLLSSADLVRNDIPLPRVMDRPIIDGPDLPSRAIRVRSEVDV